MNRWVAAAAAFVSALPTLGQPTEIKPPDIDAAVMRHSLGQFWGGVVVGKGGKVLFAKGYGVADETLKPIEADTLFDIGSVSKQFTAAGILRLEMDGKLSTEDPVAKFYPDLGGEAADRARAVTLHHLLTHTSGMSDRQAIQRLDFPDRDEAVKKALAAEPSGKVGEKFEYCNAGYVVLAAVIEKASGRAFEDYMREALFTPAGLKSTGFLDGRGLNPAKQTVRAIGTRGGGGRERRVTLFTSMGGEPWAWGLKGAGGVLTTMEDLVRWDAALRNDSVLSAAAREKLYKPDQANYALGWFIESTASGGTKAQHGGSTRGFRAQLSRYLDDDIVIGIFTNESGDLTGIEKAVTKAVVPSSSAIELELRLGNLPLNQYKAADIKNGLQCKAERDGDRVRITVLQADAPIAIVRLTPTSVPGLLADLARVTSRREDGEPDCGATLGTMVYQPDGEGVIRLSADLKWSAMKEYSGINPETRERMVDRRTTLVIMDEAKGFWPLILKLNANAAGDLAGQLEKAIATR
jgi:CubicO group peptidase (beta-lactamase class C family)